MQRNNVYRVPTVPHVGNDIESRAIKQEKVMMMRMNTGEVMEY